MIRAGVIGLGAWGARLLDKVRGSGRFEVIAILDPRSGDSPARGVACESAEQFWRQPLEAVFVAVDPRVQGELGVEVLERGLSLFIEKPMALSLTVAEQILRLARQGSVPFHVDHLVRYDALHRAALDGRLELGEMLGSVHVRLGARPRPGVLPHQVLMPHDLSLMHEALGPDGDWTATRGPEGTILARRVDPLGRPSLLWSGALQASARWSLYLGAERSAFIGEGCFLRVFRTSKELVDQVARALSASEIAALRDRLLEMTPTLEMSAEGDALLESIFAFAARVETGAPTLCDVTDGYSVTLAQSRIDAALGAPR